MKQYEKIAIEQLKPYENNARTHSEEQIELIMNSINEFGFVAPVVIDENNVILVGHGRTEAAKRLGIKEVPFRRVTHLSDDQKRAYILADNKLSDLGGWDFDILDIELGEIDLDMSEYGFDEAIDPNDFDDTFSLPDGDKPEFQQMTFSLHDKQAELIKSVLAAVDDPRETYGNTNSNGNAITEVCRQWAEQKKLL